MATASSMGTFSTAGASRQSVMSFQKRLSGGRRSVSALQALQGRTRGGLTRRHLPRVLMQGLDVTPKPLHEAHFGPGEDRHLATSALDTLGAITALPLTATTVHAAPSVSSGFVVTRAPSLGTSVGYSIGASHGMSLMGPTAAVDPILASSNLSMLTDLEDRAPSQFALQQPLLLKDAHPSTSVRLLLSETPTLWLLDIESRSVPADTDEGQEVHTQNQKANEYARSLHTFNSVDAQTITVWMTSIGTLISRVKRKNAGVQATSWELHDVEMGVIGPGDFPCPPPALTPHAQQLEEERRAAQRRQRRQLRRSVLDRISSQRSLSLSDADMRSIDSKEDNPQAEERLRVVLSLPGFRRAALLMERVLAAHAFRQNQLSYRGLPKADPLSPDLHFDYTLHQLWKLECEWAAGRNVTCLAWNRDNPDLLAVGYGKYLLGDQATGLVCIWSAKNPLLPERLFRFCSPVTILNFSRSRPNLLAIGFHDGGIALLDTSSAEKNVIADAGDSSESGVVSPYWEPIWSIAWMSGQEFNQDEQVLVTGGQNGLVVRWKRGDRGLEWTPMLHVPSAAGGEHGLPGLLGAPGRCSILVNLSLRQYAAVLCIEPVPGDPLRYLVATEDGCIHSCSTNYLHRHVDITSAHAGPVYRLSFSPFCEKIFLTCGADWAVRLWAVGINEPLVTLTSSMQAVEDAAWCPRNATIVASISGDEVCMWDLRRKTYVPASRTKWPWSTPPSTLTFSPTQDNIFVADRDGRVAVFALQDMPFAPYFQTRALAAALQRAIATKPTLLAALKKLGEPFDHQY